jgi:hypothetical protein
LIKPLGCHEPHGHQTKERKYPAPTKIVPICPKENISLKRMDTEDQDPYHPCAEGARGDAGIIVIVNDGAHFRIRRVLDSPSDNGMTAKLETHNFNHCCFDLNIE